MKKVILFFSSIVVMNCMAQGEPCSGQPAAPSTLKSTDSVCVNEIFQLSLDLTYEDDGITYQWEYGYNWVNGVEWYPATNGTINNFNTTSSTLTMNSLVGSGPMWFRCKITCNNSNQTTISQPVQVFKKLSDCYCEPEYIGGTTNGHLISGVKITQVDSWFNPPVTTEFDNFEYDVDYGFTHGQPAHIDYYDSTAIAELYQPSYYSEPIYTLKVYLGEVGNQGIAVWIDKNKDGVFQTEEKIGASNGTIGNGITIGEINDSLSIQFSLGCDDFWDGYFQGPNVKMRVRSVAGMNGNDIDPCAEYDFGQTRDYKIALVGNPAYQHYEMSSLTTNQVITFNQNTQELCVNATWINNVPCFNQSVTVTVTNNSNQSVVFSQQIGWWDNGTNCFDLSDDLVPNQSYTFKVVTDNAIAVSPNTPYSWTIGATIPCTPSAATQTISACESYTWIDGNTYTSSTNSPTFTVFGVAQYGCDSIYTLNLTINEPTTGTDVITACGSSFTWIDGITYTESNNTAEYIIEGGGSNGCDSIVTLNLTLNVSNQPCTELQASSCGAIDVEMSDVLGAISVPGHGGYRFRIIGANNSGSGWNGNTFILDRPVRNFRFSMIPGSIWGETYSVQVAVGDGNGNYGPFGAACDVTLAPLSATTQLQDSQCDITDLSQSTFLIANKVNNAAGYRFRITGANNGAQGWTGNTFVLDRPVRNFKFSMVPGSIWGETYSVEVAVLSADNVTYGDYGTACNVTLQGTPTTALQSSQCGITNVAQNTSLFANAVSGAAGYRFKVVGANNGASGWTVDTYILDRPVRNFKLSMIPGVVQGEEYEVQVAVLNADGNYGAYGAVCTITLEGAPDLVINDNNILFNDKSLTELVFGASASHNPFTTDFGIQVLNANDVEPINVIIYDMSGKLIESNTVNPMDIESARFGKNLAAGMYMITVVQGSNQVVIRQVKN